MKKMLLGLLCLSPLLAGAEAGIRRFTFGDTEVTAIQDTRTRMPSTLFKDTLKDNPVEVELPREWDSSVNVFLIRKNGKNLLIDAGNPAGKGSLLQKLAMLKIKPEEIDAVLLTHLHPDHVGGLIAADGRKAFPNADLYVARQEYVSRQDPFLAPYGDRLKMFEFNEALPEGIVGREAAGHTAGHTAYELGGLLFVGDLVHAAGLQIPHPTFCAAYDREPEQAVKSRIAVLSGAAEKKQRIFGAHIPFPGTGTVREEASPGGKLRSFRFTPAE